MSECVAANLLVQVEDKFRPSLGLVLLLFILAPLFALSFPGLANVAVVVVLVRRGHAGVMPVFPWARNVMASCCCGLPHPGTANQLKEQQQLFINAIKKWEFYFQVNCVNCVYFQICQDGT